MSCHQPLFPQTYCMATYLTLLLLLMALTSAAAISPTTSDLAVATQEMVKANYFAFVMLIKMCPLEQRIQGNITFLMPKDRMLSGISIPENSVSEFLLRHSIPSPLLFHHLEHIPSGSVIPSCEPEYMLNIDNKGRRNLSINNVRIISPNICTAGSSIRCHGIDGVLDAATTKLPSPACSDHNSITTPAVVSKPPIPSMASSEHPVAAANQSPVPAPPAPDTRKSESACNRPLSQRRLFKVLVTSLTVSMMGCHFHM